jgi:hypothetical protein
MTNVDHRADGFGEGPKPASYRIPNLLIFIGITLFMISFTLLGSMALFQIRIQDLSLGVLIFAFIFVLSFGGITIANKGLKLKQGIRDKNAIEINTFGVFLRPFSLTGKIIRVENEGVAEFENTLVRAFDKSTPVIALGKPGEAWGHKGDVQLYGGPGRILADDAAWQSVASELMHGAEFIICVPSPHPGTLWELDHIIRDGYLGKTVFVMPNEMYWYLPTRSKFKGEWDLVRDHMIRAGIHVPPYRRRGLLFSMDTKGICFRKNLMLRLGHPMAMRWAVRHLLRSLKQ